MSRVREEVAALTGCDGRRIDPDDLSALCLLRGPNHYSSAS